MRDAPFPVLLFEKIGKSLLCNQTKRIIFAAPSDKDFGGGAPEKRHEGKSCTFHPCVPSNRGRVGEKDILSYPSFLYSSDYFGC